VKEITIGGQKVRVLSVPFYLATKFEAFNDRGVDYRTSHDFEDIIYVIDNCTTVVKEISEAEEKVKSFIKDELRKVLGNSNVVEIIQSQVHPNMAAGRYPLILTKIKEIVS